MEHVHVQRTQRRGLRHIALQPKARQRTAECGARVGCVHFPMVVEGRVQQLSAGAHAAAAQCIKVYSVKGGMYGEREAEQGV